MVTLGPTYIVKVYYCTMYVWTQQSGQYRDLVKTTVMSLKIDPPPPPPPPPGDVSRTKRLRQSICSKGVEKGRDYSGR